MYSLPGFVGSRPRRTWLRLVLVAVAMSGCATSSSPGTTVTDPSSGSASPAASCSRDSEFRAHIYHPDRLFLVRQCLTLTGTVIKILHEADGDLHVRLRLDPGEPDVLLAANRGLLVVEPTCVDPVYQRDAISPCIDAPRPAGLGLLTVGAHVHVLGDLVEDTVHSWREIHPVLVVTPG
ncbi:MAG: hypothetical protein ACYDGR_03425 [Candidatus Dormibacteria bacterium]